jgi:hypothetical protein
VSWTLRFISETSSVDEIVSIGCTIIVLLDLQGHDECSEQIIEDMQCGHLIKSRSKIAEETLQECEDFSWFLITAEFCMAKKFANARKIQYIRIGARLLSTRPIAEIT